ncbi:MAG: hypothetical protein AAF732_18325 [Pseudomonadota bacterium]
MKELFLGKVWHWAAMIAAAGLLWLCGRARLHVIEFNYFVLTLLAGTAVVVLTVIFWRKDNEQVTRDELIPTQDSEASGDANPGAAS